MTGSFFPTLATAAIALGLAGSATAKKPEIRTNSKGEQLICRSINTTGSRMSKRVCKTAEEWKLILDMPEERKPG